ncbi:prepilin peptidase [Patescibacteria group bacterium]|nr:prepilin peptidase [Patescibacteria group bacterium]MBU2264702.1 prepilin peptidase [Patescibacteria group bacterium]
MIFDILFLPFVFFIGLVTSYEDIKYGKVRNKWIILGLSWGLLIIVFFFIWYFVASPITRYYHFEIQNLPDNSPVSVFTVSLGYLGRVVLNAIIAFMIAFLMWRSDAWAAGDAKLFTVYSLLIPFEYYWKSFLPYFPSFVLLINIFIPIFLYLLIRSIVYFLRFLYLKISQPRVTEKKKLFDKKKIGERLKSMGVMLLGFISIFLFFGLLQKPIKNSFNIDVSSLQMFIFAGFIIFSGSLAKIFQKAITFKIIIAFLFLMLAYGFSSFPSATWQILKQTIQNMIIFMIVLGLFRASIDFHILKTGSREIKIEELGPGMNLEETIISEIKKDGKYYYQHIGRIYPEGLTLEQAEFIKKWLKEKKKEVEIIKIYKPFPFVAWMFFGVVITLILKSSLFHLFLNLK